MITRPLNALLIYALRSIKDIRKQMFVMHKFPFQNIYCELVGIGFPNNKNVSKRLIFINLTSHIETFINGQSYIEGIA